MNCTSILVTGGASEQEKKENEGEQERREIVVATFME